MVSGERVVAAALRTPPFNLVLSEIDDPAAIDRLVEDRWDDDLPGVARAGRARPSLRRALGGARRGRTVASDLSERIFRLRR